MNNIESNTSRKNEIIDLTAASPVKQQAQQMVIDLSLDDDVGDDYTRNMMQNFAGSRRKRKRQMESKTVNPISSNVEVIDLEALPAATCSVSAQPVTTEQDEETLYKQALGPIRMEFVPEFNPKHKFAETLQNPTMKTTKLYQELLEYQLSLPVHPSSSIFVRVQESRLDLIRVAITGPEGSPYENGVFLFDCFLQDYPTRPPRVQFLTTGGGTIRFNPNLYNCGKVCLSLLGTWSGPGWEPNKSTLLQVLISIQAMVLVKDPYFNEPGFHPNQHNAAEKSEQYNRQIRSYTTTYALRDMLKHLISSDLYSEFAPVLHLHFRCRAKRIEHQLQEWVTKNSNLEKTVQEIQTLLEKLGTGS
ncbi:baculoviral IAP repeat-containing protein 6 [Fistulifera solaris]|uniref:Baculoviral IAP repeat-containing protein 6 n=1 Tax=Fistulifera solaris TaxID=1519565 RepID=A0A1Z5KIG5_FISSO|nr:baculoviral IAP repeat-containing protein 6 [Fistulifera solaris]|eukprot:GAX26100.1 baculoviral IAP repeat-containing protein 6 [Fistulifera solaris]